MLNESEFMLAFGAEFPGLLETGAKMRRMARAYRRLQLKACNEGLSDAEEQASVEIETSISRLAETLGMDVEFSGDPRGYCVYLKLPTGRSNDWGGRGWGIE